MKIQKSTEYDQIKGMLNKIRNLNESKTKKTNFILEQGETSPIRDDNEIPSDYDSDATKEQYDNIEVINDVEVKLLSTDEDDIELKPDEKTQISQLIDSFRQQVSQISELEPGLTITEKQIRLDGSLNETEINFVLIAGEDSGLYINGDMLTIEETTIEMIDKLFKFKQQFITALEPLIRERMSS
jgi:hypothetical protein